MSDYYGTRGCIRNCGRTAELSNGLCHECNRAGVATRQQLAPTRIGDEPDCWLAVIEDCQQRRAFGLKKYNVPLHPANGRNPLIDSYQEQLDQLVYLKQSILERERLMDVLRAARALAELMKLTGPEHEWEWADEGVRDELAEQLSIATAGCRGIE